MAEYEVFTRELCRRLVGDVIARGEGDAAFLRAKVVTAHFYADHLLSKVPGVRDSIVDGAESVTALALDSF